MANELTFLYLDAAGASNVVAILGNGSNVFNASSGALLGGVPSNLANAAIPMSDALWPKKYLASVPTNLAPTSIEWGTFLRSGTNFTAIGTGSSFVWDGAKVQTLGTGANLSPTAILSITMAIQQNCPATDASGNVFLSTASNVGSLPLPVTVVQRNLTLVEVERNVTLSEAR